MDNHVYVGILEENSIFYPENYSPSERYPEYQFDDISSSPNPVYNLVREGFYRLGFDVENYNTSKWNPLSHIIRKGDRVLIKPNMVMDKNYNLSSGLECLITHPSVIRAVVDYVLLALDGTGKVIIADSPVQDCNFQALIKKGGHESLLDYYHSAGIDIELVDLRERERHLSSIIVNLENKSSFTADFSHKRELRVLNYNPKIVKQHHSLGKNEYSIAKEILDADVIINMPKPKTHRFAGVTLSLKNMVGINSNKAWIPHYSAGDLTRNGDEYQHPNILKKLKSEMLDLKGLHYPTIKKIGLMYPSTMIIKGYDLMLSLLFSLHLSNDPFSGGSWYGNDTLWRTILDLNVIVRYAGKDGKMSSTPQRKVFNVADMIFAGEGQGPLSPSEKKTGIISMSSDSVCMDEVISTLMGVDYQFIPSIKNARSLSYWELCSKDTAHIISNSGIYDGKGCGELSASDVFHFKLAKGWEGYDSLRE